jgi:phosphoribosylcarboxyaminoimidazole (NCAIR) mutase
VCASSEDLSLTKSTFYDLSINDAPYTIPIATLAAKRASTAASFSKTLPAKGCF